MVSERDTAIYRYDARAQGRVLSAAEREKLIRPYLPTPRELSPAGDVATQSNSIRSGRKARRKRVRTFVKAQLHVLLYHLIHLVFGIYVRLRQIYHATIDRVLAILYYHHRTPELIQKDVKNLSRLPEHLSVILTLKGEEDGGLEALMDEVAELCAWCASAGIPLLSVYERTGMEAHVRGSIRAVYRLIKYNRCLEVLYFKCPLSCQPETVIVLRSSTSSAIPPRIRTKPSGTLTLSRPLADNSV
jgi:dehydrodolichyl diphosphate syntase complex subunit NUS1